MAVYTIEWVSGAGGSTTPGPIYSYPEIASQTFKKGHPVVFDESSEGIVACSFGTQTALGIALQDASGTTGGMVDVLVFEAGQVFSATISTSGANASAAHDKDNIGVQMALIASSETGCTDKIVLDEANTTDPWATPILQDPRDADATSGGRMLFTIIPAVYATKYIA